MSPARGAAGHRCPLLRQPGGPCHRRSSGPGGSARRPHAPTLTHAFREDLEQAVPPRPFL